MTMMLTTESAPAGSVDHHDTPAADAVLISTEGVLARLAWRADPDAPGRFVARLDGELCLSTADELEPVLRRLICDAAPRELLFDLGGVTFIDSHAAAMILRMVTGTQADFAAAVTLRVSAPVRRVLTIMGCNAHLLTP